MADILVAYSTAQGRVAWRNKTHGSWFIQAICKIFAEHAKSESLESMLVMVNDYVAGHSRVPEGYTQMPCYESHMRRKFYFIPGPHANFTKPKGLMLIINNNKYRDFVRYGTDIDERSIRALFEGFGYVSRTLENLTAEEMLAAAKEFARDDRHKHVHSCIIVVLTSGAQGIFIGADGESVKVEEFVAAFHGDKAPLLEGKPKLFLFQASRGAMMDAGADHAVAESSEFEPVLLFREKWKAEVKHLTSQLIEVGACQPISEAAQEQIAEIMSKLHVQNSNRISEAIRMLAPLYPRVGDLAQSKILYKPGMVYENFTNPKGLVLIINNYEFCTGPPRDGTHEDEKSIRDLLTEFGYDVLETQNNLKAEVCLDYEVGVANKVVSKEMLAAAQQFANDERHNLCHSCIVVVLTHGGRGTLSGSDHVPVDIEKFVGAFHGDNAPVLAGMPKLFFFQACRGDNVDQGVLTDGLESWSPRVVVEGPLRTVPRVTRPRRQTSLTQEVQDVAKKLPITSDILIAYATPLDYKSWRDTIDGSWYIQTVCKIFREHASAESLQSMLTMVHDEVARNPNFIADTKKVKGCVQMPSYETRLRKQFYFFPGVQL